MKTNHLHIILLAFFLLFQEKLTAQIGLNSTNTPPATNAMLDISSTTKGLLIPRMNTGQRTTLTATATDGLTVYDTDTKGYWFYNGTSWQSMSGGGSSPWLPNGNNIYYNTGKVGIGESAPGFPLNIGGPLGDKISLWGNSGEHYGLGIQNNLFQIHGQDINSNIAFGHGQSGSFTERARIINGGELGMSLTGRLYLRAGTQSAGLYLTNAANTANSSFIGLAADDIVGFYGTGPTQWGFVMNTNSGNLGIGNTNPQRPLSFAPRLGKKISLYPGGLGDVGISVTDSQLEMYCDYGGRAALGIDSFENGFKRLAYASDDNQKFTVEGYVSAGGYVTFSDARYKKEIETIPNALDKLLKIRGTNYHFKTNEFPKNNFNESLQFGVIAQEIEKIFPELVTNNNDGYKTVNYQGLIPILIESIKDLKKEIDKKNEDIDLLMNTLNAKIESMIVPKLEIKEIKTN